MDKYHKIQTVWLRDPSNNYKTLLDGRWAKPEFAYLADDLWVFTEKVDGTNIRVHVGDGEVTMGGRTDNAQIPATLINSLNKIFLPKKNHISEIFPNGVTFYGEGYGPKIRKGGKYREDQSFALFDINVGGIWLGQEDFIDVATTLDIEPVPYVGQGTLTQVIDMVREGFNSVWGDFLAEGIVARPAIELLNKKGERIITKIKCSDF